MKQQVKMIEKKNSMTIYVYNKLNSSISKDIICGICKENCQLKIDKERNIIYTECKQEHKIETSFEEFNNTQIIDESYIMCDFCNTVNKLLSEQFGIFFYCINCKKNMCIFCKNSHDKKHCLIDYNNKKGICLKHNDHYCSKCENCKNNLCLLCEREHDKSHKITQFREIMPDIIGLKEKVNNFQSYNDIINFIIKECMLIKQKNKFYEDRVNNFDLKNKRYRNYESNSKKY